MVINEIVHHAVADVLHDAHVILPAGPAQVHVEFSPVDHLLLVFLGDAGIAGQNHPHIAVEPHQFPGQGVHHVPQAAGLYKGMALGANEGNTSAGEVSLHLQGRGFLRNWGRLFCHGGGFFRNRGRLFRYGGSFHRSRGGFFPGGSSFFRDSSLPGGCCLFCGGGSFFHRASGLCDGNVFFHRGGCGFYGSCALFCGFCFFSCHNGSSFQISKKVRGMSTRMGLSRPCFLIALGVFFGNLL